jgi:hypothetical protein
MLISFEYMCVRSVLTLGIDTKHERHVEYLMTVL